MLVVASVPFVTIIETEVEGEVGVGLASNEDNKAVELLRVGDTIELLPVGAGKRMLAVPPEARVTGDVPVKVADTVVGVEVSETEDRNDAAWAMATEAADGSTTPGVVVIPASAITTDALDRAAAASETASCWPGSTLSVSFRSKWTG